jgi:hypothetical protein
MTLVITVITIEVEDTLRSALWELSSGAGRVKVTDQ